MFPDNSSPVEATYAWTDALRWLQQIAVALKYLHGLRPMVVHRDLKLENMLLTGLNPATADAKLADFGLCKLVKVGSGWGGVKVGWGEVGSRWGEVKVVWGGVKVGCAAYLPMLSSLSRAQLLLARVEWWPVSWLVWSWTLLSAVPLTHPLCIS